MSLADVKLERQRKRNEAADAALTAAAPLDRRQGSRNKSGKVWKPFDYTGASTPSNVSNESSGGVPVSEVRVNAFRPPSRGSSLSRPVSALSHHTSENDTGVSDGFQLFNRRRNRRGLGDLCTHESKSETRQTTVEATPDMREILEVFGKTLPGPEFLEQNTGFKDGQVQFLQHPNGDVSAQQWSADRYEWVNLGQFSNVRKKVEGQLASDRLKGETAYQTLQQGTLQYFRIIAKQREAIAMGVPFGPRDVQTAMPEPSVVSAPVASAARADSVTRTVIRPVVSRVTAVERDSASPVIARRTMPSPPHNAPREPATQRWEVMEPQHDPFTSVAALQPSRDNANYSTYNPYQAYYQGYQFPTTNTTMPSPGAQKYFADRAALATKMQHWHQVYNQNQHRVPGAQPSHLGSPEAVMPRASFHEPDISQPKPVMPTSRTAMRDQLMKLGETAKERSLSQANIRTVLHDPFQSPVASYKTEPPKPATAPRAAINQRKISILQHSSPDTQWSKRPYEHSTPLPVDYAASTSTSLASQQPLLASQQPLLITAPEQNSSSKSYEEGLHDWWKNGDTFARQEDFYQQIKASSLPPAYLTPIAPPSKTSEAAFSTPTTKSSTRLLIPVLENLASYVQGPMEKRRDYWCQWSQAPEWCIDRSEHGNDSFFEADWGSPPQRIGRDPRYAGNLGGSIGGDGSGRKVSRSDAVAVGSSGAVGWSGVDRRFAHAGRY